jgi:cell division protein FtsW (lipid II flippase)
LKQLPEALDWQTGFFLWLTVYALCYVHIVRGELIVESHLEQYCQACAIGLVAIFIVPLSCFRAVVHGLYERC